MTLGAIVRARRKRLGWTQSELAEKSGITQAQISRVEAGRSENITIENLRGIAKAFGCSVVDLLPDEDKRPAAGTPKNREDSESPSIEELAQRLSRLENLVGV